MKKFVVAHGILMERRRGKKFQTLIDVGANIGTVCIPAVARGYVERAIAIEPHPDNCRLLKANIEINGLGEQIVVHRMAAGAADGETLHLEESVDNFGDHRIRLEGSAPRASTGDCGSTVITSAKLDTICAESLKDDLLVWMDVQGFEAFVLAGSTEILNRRVPLVLEFWPGGLARMASFDLFVSSLSAYDGFINLNEPERARPIDELELLFDEIGPGKDPPGPDDFTDILVL